MKNEKLNLILETIKTNKTIKVIDLEEIVKVPRTTLLRYLKELEEKGEIIKTFGEVEIRKSNHESYATGRINSNVGDKVKLAKEAAKLVKPGDIIYLDGGSSTYYLMGELKEKEITIYTNNLLVLNFINNDFKPEVHFIPGKINKTTLAVASSETILGVKDLIFDKSFIGFNSLNNDGYSTTNEAEAVVKKTVIQQTRGTAYAIGRENKAEERSNFFFAHKAELVLVK